MKIVFTVAPKVGLFYKFNQNLLLNYEMKTHKTTCCACEKNIIKNLKKKLTNCCNKWVSMVSMQCYVVGARGGTKKCEKSTEI